jgi:hypothetical protein
MGLAGSLDFSLKVSDGAGWRTALAAARATGVVTLPQGAVVDGPLTGAAVQASPLDATAGRLLAAGAYGLGGPLPPIGDASVTDGSLVPAFYAYDSGQGSSGGPAGVERGMLLHARRGAAAGETQLLIVESGSLPGVYPGLHFGRSRSGGAWSGWACGALRDSASGAGGRVLRTQDGTQTCWHSLTTSATAETVWTFPLPFASAEGLVVTMGLGEGGPVPLVPRFAAKAPASVALSAFDLSGARVAAALDVIAVGRWF